MAKKIVYDNSLVGNMRKENALNEAFVTPKFNVDQYSYEMQNP